MKYLLYFIAATFTIACSETTRQDKIADIDIDSLSNGIQITVTENKDTHVLITKTDTLNRKKTIEETRPYKKSFAPDTLIVQPAPAKR